MVKAEKTEIQEQLSGMIFNIQRFSVQDGPGIRTLIFFKGCPLRCLWCCNPESQDKGMNLIFNKVKCIGCGRCIAACDAGAISDGPQGKAVDREKCNLCGKCINACFTQAMEMAGEIKTVDELMAEILKDVALYKNSGGGVTLGGGEPMAQAELAAAVLKECRSQGINTAIETCGFAAWDSYEKVLKYTDLVLFDIKHLNSNRHKKLTGHGNERILDNFRKIAGLSKRIIARIPLIPGLNTSSENIDELGCFLRANEIAEAHLLPYHKLGVNKYASIGLEYTLDDIPPVADSDLEYIEGSLKALGIRVTVYNH